MLSIYCGIWGVFCCSWWSSRDIFLFAFIFTHFSLVAGIVHPVYDPNNPVPCVRCKNLKYCPAIDELMVQEKYYPKNLNYLESCAVLDALGELCVILCSFVCFLQIFMKWFYCWHCLTYVRVLEAEIDVTLLFSGERMYNQIFGNGRTFRDNDICRSKFMC